MITSNDKLFCILASCEKHIAVNNLSSYMYLFQLAGYDFNFKFKIQSSGLRSSFLNNYLDTLDNEGYIVIDDSCIKLTQYGKSTLDDFILSLDELERFEKILNTLNNFDKDELYFLVIVDMVISEVRKKSGVEGLASEKNRITSLVKSLTKDYTDEDFDASIKFLRMIKGDI